MTHAQAEQIRLSDRVVDLATGEIFDQNGGPIEMLAPRPLGVLQFLVAHRDEVVTRDELLEGVWGHLEAGSDDAVNVAVSSLRKALDDTDRPYRLIETLSRRGYRYAGPRPTTDGEPHAESAVAPATTSDPKPAKASQKTARPWGWAVLGVLALLAIAAAVLIDWSEGDPPPVADSADQTGILSAAPAIAVLPFLDVSMEGDYRPFADALVDSILHMLAQIPELRVVARTSSFAFRDSEADIKEIAAQLRVTAVLEGSVQRANDRIRVIAQLVDAESGNHLWSRTYDRAADDLFEIQDDIAAQVAQALNRTLIPSPHGPENLAAFEQVALGQHEYAQDTVESALKAQAHFERALEISPQNVEAMVGLALAMAQEARLSGFSKDHPGFEGYQALIKRAYEIAPNDVRAVKLRGDLAFTLSNREQAENYYQRAVDLAPSYADGYAAYGRTLWRRGAFDEALDALRIAHDLDPLSDMVNALLADAYWSVGRAEEAMARLRENIRRNPEFARYYDRMATYLNQIGETGEAMRHIQAQRQLDPDSGMRWFRVCEFYNQLDMPDASEACTDELEAAHDMPWRVLYLRQQIASIRGDWPRQRQLVRELLGNSDMEMIPVIAAVSHASVDCEQTLGFLEPAYPEFFAEPPALQPMLTMGAEFAVYCLRQVGRDEQAEALLQAVEETVERLRMMRGPHFVSGMEGIILLALQEKYDEAVDAFEQAVDNGWRYYWWGLDQYPMLDPIRGHPRYQAALRRLHAEVEKQRQYFQAHADEPLI